MSRVEPFIDRSVEDREMTCPQVPCSWLRCQVRSRYLNIQAEIHSLSLPPFSQAELEIITIHDLVETYYQLLSLVHYKVLSLQAKSHSEVRRIRSGLKKGVLVEMLRALSSELYFKWPF